MTTFVLITLLFASLAVSWLALAIFLYFGLRWMKVPKITTAQTIIATASVSAVQLSLTILILFLATYSGLLAVAVFVPAAIFLPALIIAKIFQTSIVRGFAAWFIASVLSTVVNFLLALPTRALVIEAFVMPTNGMAPTLLGEHCQAVCPQCSQPNFCSAQAAQREALELPNWICPNFHVNQIPQVDLRQFPGDRIICSKFLKPKRWDILAFRFPVNPTSVYAQRVVGMPGETVHIEDGAVWIDGKKLEPPDSLRGIQYLDKIPGVGVEMAGTTDNPAILGPDEYFVLGDFSAQSSDSRFWYGGAEGHPDYAVPVSHIKGVITHIYWPPSRWRVFR